MIKILIEKLLYKWGYISLEHHENLANAYNWALVDIKESFNFIDSLRDDKISPEAKIKINQYISDHDWVDEFEVRVVYEEEFDEQY